MHTVSQNVRAQGLVDRYGLKGALRKVKLQKHEMTSLVISGKISGVTSLLEQLCAQQLYIESKMALTPDLNELVKMALELQKLIKEDVQVMAEDTKEQLKQWGC